MATQEEHIHIILVCRAAWQCLVLTGTHNMNVLEPEGSISGRRFGAYTTEHKYSRAQRISPSRATEAWCGEAPFLSLRMPLTITLKAPRVS